MNYISIKLLLKTKREKERHGSKVAMGASLRNYDIRQYSEQEVKVVGPWKQRSGETQLGSSEDIKFAVCLCIWGTDYKKLTFEHGKFGISFKYPSGVIK